MGSWRIGRLVLSWKGNGLLMQNTRLISWVTGRLSVVNKTRIQWQTVRYCDVHKTGSQGGEHGSVDGDYKDGALDVLRFRQLDELRTDDELGDSENEHYGHTIKDNSLSIRRERQRLLSTDKMFADLDEELLESIEPYITPRLPASPTFAAYVDRSETLSNLVKLGMDLSKVEKRWTFKDTLIKMDFDKDIAEKISLLHHIGVEDQNLGKFLTVNPFILTHNLQNLEARVEYLKRKKFTEEDVAQIVSRAPYFLNFKIHRIDYKLGFYQQHLSLSGDELRYLITRNPKLVTCKADTVKRSMFAMTEQMGFSRKEFKKIVLSQPKVLLTGKFKLLSTFDYLHNTVGMKHKHFVQFPNVFRSSLPRIKERHQYLTAIDRAQYNPTQPGYVALEKLAKLPDEIFCQEVAKTTIMEYNTFLKSQ